MIGRVENETDASYFADTSHVSRTMLEVFLRDPAEYHWRFCCGVNRDTETPAMRRGSLVHSYVLGQRANLTVIPEGVLSKSGSRVGAAFKRFVEENSDSVLVTQAEMDELAALAEAVHENRAAAALIAQCYAFEQPIRWIDEQTGLLCKAKPDGLGGLAVIDLKTTRDVRPKQFTDSVLKYGYHRQAAWYLNGINAVLGLGLLPFVFIAVTSSPPFKVCCYDLDEAFIELGRQQCADGLARLAKCAERGDWKTEAHGQIVRLSLPAWATKTEWEVLEHEHNRDEDDGTSSEQRGDEGADCGG